MKRRLPLLFVLSTMCPAAQMAVPEGIKVHVRLEQAVSSATARTGDKLEFTVMQAVKIGESVVIAEKAKAVGTVTESVKHSVVKVGRVDFSVDRVMAADGQWIPLRYSANKSHGGAHHVLSGVLSAGVAMVAGPPIPVLMAGRATAAAARQLAGSKDVVVPKGSEYEVYSDAAVTVSVAPAPEEAARNEKADHAAPKPEPPVGVAAKDPQEGVATITVSSSQKGDDIEVDGAFAGSTPSTIKLAAGSHLIRVTSGQRVWERNLHLTAGSTVNLEAVVAAPKPAVASQRNSAAGPKPALASSGGAPASGTPAVK